MAYIGPTLPPHLKKKREESSDSEHDDTETSLGPVLPPHLHKKDAEISAENTPEEDDEDPYGPALPPHLKLQKTTESSTQNSDPEDAVGPALPPHLRPNIKGPSLPPGLSKRNEESDSDEEDDYIVGPVLPTSQASYDEAAELDRRARKMKAHLRGEDREEDTALKRESWMLELPEVHAKAFGLGPRQFQKTAKPDLTGRDEWTATPGTAKKTEPSNEDITKELMARAQEEKRNAELEKVVQENNKSKRTESLMKVHEKDRKRKKDEEDSKPKERRAFDRDIDLKANQLDDAKKKALIKKSQQLGSRFFTGSQKFL